MKLSNLPQVFSIEDLPNLSLLNRWSSGYVQTANTQFSTTDNIFSSYHPLYDKGFTGEGKVLTVVDSGLDYNNFLFSSAASLDAELSSDVNSRKLYDYLYTNGESDRVDTASGHGTHVAATAAGKSVCSGKKSQYNGVARDAQILFYDIGKGTKLIVPDYQKLYRKMLSQPKWSLISSNSWASDEENPSLRYLYEYLSYTFPQVLNVFAAGNDGTQGDFTVFAPSSSKNVLTVGALAALPASSLSLYSQSTSACIEDETDHTKVCGTASAALMTLVNSVTHSAIHGATIINSNTDNSELATKVFVGAVSDVSGNTNKPLAVVSTTESDLTATFDKPVVVIPSNQSTPISAMLGHTVSIYPYVSDFAVDIATFSSRGPTNRGVLKPEVLAPGSSILSAKSLSAVVCEGNISVGLSVKSGTSMACPAASGGITLLLDALQNLTASGISFLSKDQTKLNISMSLKALAIATAKKQFSASATSSAVLLSDDDGNTDDKDEPMKLLSGSVSQIPDDTYGYGVLNVSDAIPELSNTKTIVVDSLNLQQGHYVFQLTPDKDDHDLRIVVSWADYALSASSVAVSLIQDIDLVVEDPDSNLHFNFGNFEDHYSSTERVVIEKDDIQVGKTYKVHIYVSVYHSAYSSNVSLAIIGPVGSATAESVANELSSTSNTCPSKCTQNGGTCSSGSCVCGDATSGRVCQLTRVAVELDKNVSIDLKPHETAYFKAKLDTFKYNFSIRFFDLKSVLFANLVGASTAMVPYEFLQQIPLYEDQSVYVINKTDCDLNDGDTVYFSLFNLYPQTFSGQFRFRADQSHEDYETVRPVNTTLLICLIVVGVLIIAAIVFVVVFMYLRSKKISQQISTSKPQQKQPKAKPNDTL